MEFSNGLRGTANALRLAGGNGPAMLCGAAGGAGGGHNGADASADPLAFFHSRACRLLRKALHPFADDLSVIHL